MVVKRTFFKHIRREIGGSLGRFAAIFAITALGVGFLAGLLSTAPDFYTTIDDYYDKNDFWDINIKSTGGLTEEDLKAVEAEDEVSAAVLCKTADVTVKKESGDGTAARVYADDDDSIKNKGKVNKTELKSGRYPEKAGECLALVPNPFLEQPALGTVYRAEKADVLTTDELTVVGVVESPMYMSIEKEGTDIANGRISVVLYTVYDTFNTDYYTDIFLTLKGAKELNTFYGEYESLRDDGREALEKTAEARENARYDELKKAAVDIALAAPEGKAAAAMGLEDKVISAAENRVKKPEWYILDRESNVSFVSLKANAEKVNSIAKVFPVFFFAVAALVALTTMTRMVDEERTEIGTLKALGFSSRAIAAKYLLYAGAAAVTGGVFGLALGLYLFPTVIINVYRIMYRLPEIHLSFNAPISLGALTAAVICILAATLWAVIAALRENPAALMLPKAPKSGKRILLERVGFIWRRMKFTHKVTARNLFRYKKRLFMTVIGISGCTALLLTGFGLKDAIGDIVPKQYEEIQQYDLTVLLSDTADDATLDYFRKNTESFTEIHSETGFVLQDGKELEINFYIPEKTEELVDFVRLRERKSGEKLAIQNGGAIITEKFATSHGIKKGDTVTLKTKNGEKAEAKINGICENYINSYVYMTPEYYSELFGKDCTYSTLLIKSGVSADKQDNMTREILATDGVVSASFSTFVIESFDNMISSINYIVLVLIISAGTLAFVVLYNLTNINISERIKEIATIKVLGFFDLEVNAYVCRETYLLSLIGTAVGLFLGVFLCRFVVYTAEMESVMFGRTIYPRSFIFAAVITIVFTVAVNLALTPRLKRVDMVESMKSVD